MEFFDKKQDVIDLQLTQFGRFLLSKGRFKPEFYAFYDDNILYNSENAGTAENQNDSEKRIREAQTMQPQTGFCSLEREFENSYKQILSGKTNALSQDFQRTEEKHYLLGAPVGTSDVNSEYSPAWSVRYLNGQLSGSVDFLRLEQKSEGQNLLRIPQLETNIEIDVALASESELEEDEAGTPGGGYSIVSEEEDLYVLLKVTEENGMLQTKNFDIEMYEIQEVIENDKTIEHLRPLQFLHEASNITFDEMMDEENAQVDHFFAEYYFDIFVDEEISDEVLCKHDPVDESMGVFADSRTKECINVLEEQGKTSFDIYEEEADSPEEPC